MLLLLALFIQEMGLKKINIGCLMFQNIAGDDLLSLENALLRRSKKYFNINTRPSLLIIDGGKLQLGKIVNTLKKMNLNEIFVISIVKGSKRLRATETILCNSGVIEMKKDSKAFLLLQEIETKLTDLQ